MSSVNVIDLKKECENSKNIVITGHVRPDGDCVGACMATYLYLMKVLIDVSIKVCLEPAQDIFGCIKDFDKIDTSFPELENIDTVIIIDCEKSRIGDAQKYLTDSVKCINIDHHISNERGSGDVNYVVPTASSASELIYDVIDKSAMDEEIAKAIYIGMIHDTGIFQYSNTSPKTLRIASELLEFGFDFPTIIDETFYEKTYVQNQILGRALLESIMFMDGKCIVSSLDMNTMKFYNVTPADLDGIVNQLRIIKGVECAIFMYEVANQQYKVSLRSCKYIDVSKVAEYFGGGGHVRAAGCNMNGNFYDVVNNISGQIELQMKVLEESKEQEYN